MTEWRQRTVDALFVATEAIAWYLLLHVGATGLEQSFLGVVRDRLTLGMSTFTAPEAARAREALSQIDIAASMEHGPAFFVVLATAFGGFLLMRLLMRYRFDGTLGAVALIAGSVLGLNILLHLGISGDLRVWDPTGLVGYVNDPEQAFAGQVDLNQLVSGPISGRSHGMALGLTFIGLVVMWVRFAIAARGVVTFDRVLRSFTIGFVVALSSVILARFEGQNLLAAFAVPHFIFGILALAVANNARSVVPIEGERRTGPWAAAVGGTVAILAGVAATLGLLALVNAGAALNVIGSLAGRLLVIVIIVVTTPIFWILEKIVRFLLPADIAKRFQDLNLRQMAALEPPSDLPNKAAPAMPLWLQAGLKFLAVLIIAWVVWKVAQFIMRRRRGHAPPVDEVRGRATGGGGIGELLRDLFPRVVRNQAVDWMRAQPIYRLYGRAVHEAERRGFRYLPGETPLEFSERASSLMTAPPYEPIGDAFDRARYGRDFPSHDEVRAMEADLQRWEAATPPSEELRQRLAGAQPLSEDAETLLMISRVRQATQAIRRARRGQIGPGPGGSTPI